MTKKVLKMYHLTPTQEGMLFYSILNKGSRNYIEQACFKMTGNIRPDLLREAWETVIARHEVLRTDFMWKQIKVPVQLILNEKEAEVFFQDLSSLNVLEQKAAIAELKERELASLNLEGNRLNRVVFVKTGVDTTLMCWTCHHILLDGWSVSNILKDFLDIYHHLALKLPMPQPPLAQFSDYLEWLKQRNKGKGLQFWKEYLKDLTTPTLLPGDRADLRWDVIDQPVSTEGELDEATTISLNEFCKKMGITLNAFIQTAWGLLLQRYTNTTVSCSGMTSAGRTLEVKNVSEIVGVLINTIPVVISTQPTDTVRQLLNRVNAELVDVREHGYLALPEIQGVSPLEPTQKFFDSLVVVENHPASSIDLGNPELKLAFDSSFELTNYDFALQVKNASRFKVSISYNASLFDSTLIDRVKENFLAGIVQMLESADAPVAQLAFLAERERKLLVRDFNTTYVEYDRNATILDILEQHVASVPDRPALVFEKQVLTYRELNRRSNQLARVLQTKGVPKGQIVAIMVERSCELIVAQVAVMKAGGVFLSIDPGNPEARIAFMLEDSQAQLLLTETALFGKMADFTGECLDLKAESHYIGDEGKPEVTIGADDLAYVIYTSGSTGKPKGAMLEHRGLVNLRNLFMLNFAITPEDRLVQFASCAFDASVWETSMALLNGATLYLVKRETLDNYESFTRFINENGITVVTLPPMYLSNLRPEDVQTLRLLITGGSAPSYELVNRWNDQVRYVNAYGPTETTVCATVWNYCHEETTGKTVPIGRPIANTQVYILGQANQPVPIGVAGELCIAGDSVGRGYLNRPELTQEKFVANPFALGTRMYRSGDLARWLPDGNIEFLGRIDHQVKIRGFRIELGEIENQLLAHREVREAAVIAREDAAGDKYICAYLVSNITLETADLRAYLAKELPDYMIPAHFVQMAALPINNSGKVDLKALPAPEGQHLVGTEYIAPTNSLEEKLAQIWADCFKVKRVGIADDFFALGGHSLKAIQIAANIFKEMNTEIPLRTIFDAPTVKELALVIAKKNQTELMEEGQAEHIEQTEPIEQTGHTEKTKQIDHIAQIENTEHTQQKGRTGQIEHTEQIQPTVQRTTTIPVLPAQEYYPVSSAQKRLYAVRQMTGDTITYNIPLIWQVMGELACARMEEVLFQLMVRHEVLRTSFVMVDGEVMQKIHPALDFKLDRLEGSIDQLIAQYIRPFDLSQAPLMRAAVARVGDALYFILDIHHIIADGVSMDHFFKEMAQLYARQTLPEMRLQYRDFAAWQNNLLSSEAFKTEEEFWLRTFAGEISALNLPLDYSRPAVMSYDGDSYQFALPQDVSMQLNQLARKEGCTLHMVLLAILNVLLARYSGQEDIIVGSPISGKPHADLAPILGMFVNTLALRNRPTFEKTFKQFLAEVRENALQAYEHQNYQIEHLIEKLQLQRDLSRNALFQVMFNLYKGFEVEIPVEELKFIRYKYNFHRTKFDITFNIIDQPEGLHIDLEYCTRLFKRETMERMGQHLENIIREVVTKPESTLAGIELVTPEEREQLLHTFNATAVDYPRTQTIVQLFEAQVEKTPERTAVTYDGLSLTYRELNARANVLARTLRYKGVGPDQVVGILALRSLEMIVGVLAIVKAGGAYLPLDPDYPDNRIQFMLKDAAVQVCLAAPKEAGRLRDVPVILDPAEEANYSAWAMSTATETNERTMVDSHVRADGLVKTQVDGQANVQANAYAHTPTHAPVHAQAHAPTHAQAHTPANVHCIHANLPHVNTPDDLIYIIYTSGSTGEPKGVMVQHQNVNRLISNSNMLVIGEEDRILQTGSLAFDASTFEIWGALLNGAGLYLVSKADLLSPEMLEKRIQEYGITMIWLTAALFNQLLEQNPRLFLGLKCLLVGGDVLSPKHINQVRALYPALKVVNGYGPTESTTFTTYFPIECDYDDSIPIGYPVSNTRVYILGAGMSLAPIGVPGELCIAGDGLARGYLHRPELTAERFVQNPYEPGHRMYRTGDLARWLPDGKIEFIGRIDAQVKLRGFRIELGEIENQLLRHPAIQKAVVIVRQEAEGSALSATQTTQSTENGKYLCAYIVSTEELSIVELRQFLGQALPDYMIPAYFVRLTQIPLTSNGKVDRQALPKPDGSMALGGEYIAPRNEVESRLVAIWTQILGQEKIGIKDSFFDLGGNSIKLINLVNLLKKEFDRDIQTIDLFHYTTISQIAEYLFSPAGVEEEEIIEYEL